MNIALISHSSRIAGGEMMLLNLAKLISQYSKHKVYLIYPADVKDDMMTLNLPLNITLIKTSLEDWYINADEGSYDQGSVFRRKVTNSVQEHKNLFTRLGIDLVIINTLTRIGPVIATVDLNIPYILWAHGVIDSYYFDKGLNPYKMCLDRALIRLSAQTITCSKWVTDYYKDLTGLKDIQTIYNWTDVNKEDQIFNKRNKHHCTFVCLNTLDPHKGYQVLLEASASLASRGYDFEVNIHADGRLKEWLVDRIKNTKIDKCVHYKGRSMDISSIYRSADCLINPSFVEPFGMTIIEAMSYGKPVIASHSGGPDEIVINGQTGLLAKLGDPADLERCMEMIITNPGSAEGMGLNGYHRYKDSFSVEMAIKTILPLIEATSKSFAGYSNDQSLISLLIREQLAEYHFPRLKWRFPTISPTQIVTTKPLKGEIRIIVPMTVDTLTFIYLLFGTHGKQVKGKGNIKLFSIKGRLLREVNFPLDLIKDSEWFAIPLTPIENVRGKLMIAVLSILPEEEHVSISLYQKRTISPFKRVIRYFLRRTCQCYIWACTYLE